jgi:histidinol phosphatase-like PHP family hydrolase
LSELSNAEIAELLARQAAESEGILQRAFKKAARNAFLWPEQASSLWKEGRPLTELKGIGPYIAQRLQRWLEKPPPDKVRPPPLRRDFMALADAKVLLAKNPLWITSLRGDLQMHTHWSDGSGSLEEMAESGAARGYEYIAITDHSKGLKIAGGIDEAKLTQQGKEIDALNQTERSSTNITILRSIEMNLNPRGEGDMEPAALARLDLVLGSFHSSLRTTEDQTARYLAAIRNPHVHIHGHPRGRIYNYRLGLRADWARVFAEAARHDKAVEIDCYPDRQDLNVALLRIAREEGVLISLGTDAHHASQFGFIELGLAAALKAKIPSERIVNFLPLADLRKWARPRRRQRR